jgi:enamine deaminase RidA (YjgF/YER057c/UK114 family)
MADKQLISSGTPWEAQVGYSRAVRVGNHVFVSGTTASDASGQVVGEGDLYAQTVYIFQKIERALQEAGATLNDVVRTRVYLTDMSRWSEAGRAHGEVFGNIRPANAFLGISALITPAHLVEIELDAIIGAGG